MAGFLAALLLATSPVAASDAGLYDRLASLDAIVGDYEAHRTPQGIEFVSRKLVTLPSGLSHAKYHIEVEGPLPAGKAKTIQQVAQVVAAVVEPEVDATQVKADQIAPGIDAGFVDINGTVVAILDYRANNDAHPYRTRIALLSGHSIYTATMSLHTDDEMDREILALYMLVVGMVNSGELEPSATP